MRQDKTGHTRHSLGVRIYISEAQTPYVNGVSTPGLADCAIGMLYWYVLQGLKC